MSKAFDKIMAGLDDARVYLNGDESQSVTHQIQVEAIDVSAIRETTGLSQAQFARSIGVAKGTLLNWEHGRRSPQGPAKVLLALVAKRPSIVQELLAENS
ncbi:MAG: helix-turn-helix domain-containing protein [Geminicoccaceae bacterium]|nr:helix-turn-helix domain-containing protein [Geminicoccaceae bacterium]